jgi:head-tail adaptor
MLTQADITQMRETQAAALPDQCTIQRKSDPADSRGGQTVSYSDHATGVNCRLGRNAQSARPGVRGDRTETPIPWVVTFAYNQDVQMTDRIVIDSRTFEVMSVEAHTDWMTALRVKCIERAGSVIIR